MPRIKIENISGLSDFFCVVEEPAFSKSKLEQLQEKYGVDTLSFITYEEFFTNVSAEDANDWKFSYTIYTNSGGVLDDLNPLLNFKYLDTSENAKVGQETEGDENVSLFIFPTCYEISILDE